MKILEPSLAIQNKHYLILLCEFLIYFLRVYCEQMLVSTSLFTGDELGIRAQSILWCEVPNEIKSWILFIIRALCCIKLAIYGVNGLPLCVG